jgi:hypothetical protein
LWLSLVHLLPEKLNLQYSSIYGFLAEEYKGLNDLQVMWLIKFHCSMQICLLPKSKMWVEADHHSISRLSQEQIPQVFVPKIEASEFWSQTT